MGGKFTINNARTSPKAEPTGKTGAAGGTGTGGESNSTLAPAAGGTGRTGGTGAAGGKTEEKKSAGLVVVDAEKPTIPAPPEKAPDKKPKKVRKNKKQAPALPVEQVDALIVSLSGIVASRPKCEHWLISEQEAHTISEPLCNILDKYEVFNKVGSHSDAIALMVASVSVFLPRAMISIAMMKEGKKRARTGQTTDIAVKENPPKASSGELSRRTEQQHGRADDASYSGSGLSFLGAVIG